MERSGTILERSTMVPLERSGNVVNGSFCHLSGTFHWNVPGTFHWYDGGTFQIVPEGSIGTIVEPSNGTSRERSKSFRNEPTLHIFVYN